MTPIVYTLILLYCTSPDDCREVPQPGIHLSFIECAQEGQKRSSPPDTRWVCRMRTGEEQV